MSTRKKIAALARQLFKLSFEGDQLSSERVGGVLAWVEKHRPPHPTAVLRAYKRLVEAEIDRRRAVIEFAGAVAPAVFQEIASAMSTRYGYRIEAVPMARPDLIAGVRVRVGCDIFEKSIAGQLASLSPTA
jgi:F-type H+-transporting ATPase subunit delta